MASVSLSDTISLQQDRGHLLRQRRELLDALLVIDCQIQEIDDLIGAVKPAVQTLDASVVEVMRGAS